MQPTGTSSRQRGAETVADDKRSHAVTEAFAALILVCMLAYAGWALVLA